MGSRGFASAQNCICHCRLLGMFCDNVGVIAHVTRHTPEMMKIFPSLWSGVTTIPHPSVNLNYLHFNGKNLIICLKAANILSSSLPHLFSDNSGITSLQFFSWDLLEYFITRTRHRYLQLCFRTKGTVWDFVHFANKTKPVCFLLFSFLRC